MSLLRIPSRKSYITGFYKIRYYCQSKENEEQVLKCRTLIEFYKNYFGKYEFLFAEIVLNFKSF